MSDPANRRALANALLGEGQAPFRPGPTNALANVLAGSPWTPQQEHQYQTFMAFDPNVRQWRNAFQNRYGEQPQIDGGNYDYRAAWQAGAKPQQVPGDTIPHWSSVGKADNHPTMWKQQFMTQFGVDPDTVTQWTPAMQEWMRGTVNDAASWPPLPAKGLF